MFILACLFKFIESICSGDTPEQTEKTVINYANDYWNKSSW
jgi:hypothetical protein